MKLQSVMLTFKGSRVLLHGIHDNLYHPQQALTLYSMCSMILNHFYHNLLERGSESDDNDLYMRYVFETRSFTSARMFLVIHFAHIYVQVERVHMVSVSNLEKVNFHTLILENQ